MKKCHFYRRQMILKILNLITRNTGLNQQISLLIHLLSKNTNHHSILDTEIYVEFVKKHISPIKSNTSVLINVYKKLKIYSKIHHKYKSNDPLYTIIYFYSFIIQMDKNQIYIRTQNKIKQNQSATIHQTIINSRKYTVLPNVFSPKIFLGTQWLINQLIINLQIRQTFLQIGIGCGCTLIQLLLANKIKYAYGSDINPASIQCSKQNQARYNLKTQLFRSDVFDSIPKELKFDAIYWNYPFHPSNQQYEQMSMIQKSVRDPGYKHLYKYLQGFEIYLRQKGRMFLGFSTVMGSEEDLMSIANKFGLKVILIGQRWSQNGLNMQLIEFKK